MNTIKVESFTCNGCKETKPLTGFPPIQKGKSRPWLCRECNRTYAREYARKRRRAAHIDLPPMPCGNCGQSFTPARSDTRTCSKYCSQRLSRLSDPRMRWLIAQKSEPCTDCRRAYPPVIMQFDHMPEFEKKFEVNAGQMFAHQMPDIIAERAKCELVCPTCHALRTASRGSWHGMGGMLLDTPD